MTVAFSYYGAQDEISGVTSWLQGLLQGLRSRGDEMSLHLHHSGGDPALGNLYRHAKDFGVNVSGVPLPRTTREGVIDTLEFLNRSKPLVFLPLSLPAPHFAARIAQDLGLPWIFTIHSDDPEYWALAESCAPQREHGVVVAVSEVIGAEARKRFPQADVRVIPYGVTVPTGRAIWNDEVFRVVYSGRLVEEQKCILKVLEVFLAACRQAPRIEAVFLGDGPERGKLEERVRREGMERRIRFAGRLASAGVWKELLEAQAFILMSDFEGLPVSMLEAMASGLVPVVRNIRSGIPEVVTHLETGLLVGNDVPVAAKALTELAADKAGWTSMATASRTLVAERYSEEKCLDIWRDLIHELAKKATVRYPLPVPWFPSLPAYDKRLWKFDQRSPVWLRKIKRKLKKAPGALDG